ncbi:hypothetical protein [Bacillus sp. Marseille-P3661]|uniref:hypothetical protein n=1 Tax=Bacillus sp. Marseille-P3661 TaxID=1936234 RepID=UPI000C8321D8|nr:hypothetical protein [Bacillus sp. Marseille-P3661]
MNQVTRILKKNEAKKRIPVLKLEIDYELATLYDAMITQDNDQIRKSKARLEQFRLEMLRLEA